MEHERLGPDASPAEDAAVRAYLGSAHPTLVAFADLLADHGVLRGLIGPREVPRLWTRHLLNCAAVAAYLPERGTVIDVGSGAGLPGVVLASMRPDLHTVLLEPMERRAQWLREVIDLLGLTSAEVVRARAEEVRGRLSGQAVTARAVAPLPKLIPWALPLLAPGGVLLAMKGARAEEELRAADAVIARHGGRDGEALLADAVPRTEPTTLVRVVKSRST